MRRLACLLLLATWVPAFAQEMEPGEWEFTTTMTMPMMPQPMTMTHTQCLKKEDTDPSRLKGKDPGQSDCTASPARKSGGTVTWDVTCPQSGMRGSGTARVTRNTVESEMRMSAEAGGQKFEMLTKTSGRRLGPCK